MQQLRFVQMTPRTPYQDTKSQVFFVAKWKSEI